MGLMTMRAVVADLRAWAPKARYCVAGHDYGKVEPGVIRGVEDVLGGPDQILVDSSWLKWIRIEVEGE